MKKFKQNELAYLMPRNFYFVYFMGKLIVGRPIKVTFTKSICADGESMYDIETEFESNSGYFSVHGFEQVFSNKDDFENRVNAEVFPIAFDNTIQSSKEKLCCKLLGYKFESLSYWVLDRSNEKDLFVEKTLPMNKFWYDYTTMEWKSDELPTCDFFPTRESAISWSAYNIALADGTEKRVVGKNALLLLDEDQRSLVDQFVDIMKKMKEHKIVIQTDICDNIYAYNVRNIEAVETTYDNLSDDNYERCDGWNNKFKIGTILEYGDDNDIWIKRKEDKF